jgi:hypothetical protein
MTDAGRLERILAALDNPADREWLRAQLEPAWQRRARRPAERDEAVRQLAIEYSSLDSGRAIAVAMRKALGEVARKRASPAPLRRILKLSGGKVPSVPTLRRALAGLAP